MNSNIYIDYWSPLDTIYIEKIIQAKCRMGADSSVGKKHSKYYKWLDTLHFLDFVSSVVILICNPDLHVK